MTYVDPKAWAAEQAPPPRNTGGYVDPKTWAQQQTPAQPWHGMLSDVPGHEDDAPATVPRVSRGTSAARGLAQGATLDFNDEIQGALDPVVTAIADISQGVRPGLSDVSVADQYRGARDAYRRNDDDAKAANPWTYRLANVAGTVATAPLAGSANGLKAATVTGGKIGAALGLGGSRADITHGEVGGAAIDTAAGAAAGALAGAAGYGLVKGATAAGRSIIDKVKDVGRGIPSGATASEAALAGEVLPGLPAATERAAKDAALQVAKHPNAPSAFGGTVGESTESGRQLFKYWSDLIKEEIVPRPSQLTGSRAAGLSEMRMRNFGGPAMDIAQSEYAKQVGQGARVIDELIKGVAADPSRLGRADVTDGLVGALKSGVKSLYEARSAVAGPLYDAAEQAGGRVDGRPIIKEIQTILTENRLNPSQITNQLASMLDKVKNASRGALSIRDANNLRKLMGSVVSRQGSILDGVEMDVQAQIAGRIRGAIDDVFDRAAELGDRPGIELLRKANAAWSAGSRAIDEQATGTVLRLIGRVAKDAGAAENIPRQLLSMEYGQVSGIFKILNKTAPDIARQTRAQMLEEAMNQFGKPNSAAPLAAELGLSKLSPGAAAAKSGLPSMEKAFQAAFEGDPAAQHALRHTNLLMQRLSFGPNIQGSTTAPQLADAMQNAPDALATLADMAAGKAAGGAVRTFFSVLGNMTGNNAAMADAMGSTPGIKAFNEALMLALKAKGGTKITEQAARTMLAAMAKAGIGVMPKSDSALPSDEPNNDRQPTGGPVVADNRDQAYQQWLKQYGIREDPTYNTRAAFEAGLKPDENGHMQDTYKLPNHPTFSNESQYSGKDGKVGGQWVRNPKNGNQWTFKASPWNVKNMSPEQLKRYFDQVEPGNILQLPDGSKYVGGSTAVANRGQ